MEAVAIVTVLTLIEYFVFAILVARARIRSGVKAPATSGDPVFERYFRVQQNTLEQLVIFLPALWLFGLYVDWLVGAGLGLLFIVGRALYCRGYVEAPARRGPGFVIGQLAQTLLLLGALVGALRSWLA